MDCYASLFAELQSVLRSIAIGLTGPCVGQVHGGNRSLPLQCARNHDIAWNGHLRKKRHSQETQCSAWLGGEAGGKGDLEQWTGTWKWDKVKTTGGKLTFEIKPEWQERDSCTKPGAQHSEDRELRMPSPKLGCTCWAMKNREARVASAWSLRGMQAPH